jgi:mono/diheme cytochrome c family protein
MKYARFAAAAIVLSASCSILAASDTKQNTDGVKGEMPSFARKLNDSDIRALTAYLRTLHS